jgi:hypothetical protein
MCWWQFWIATRGIVGWVQDDHVVHQGFSDCIVGPTWNYSHVHSKHINSHIDKLHMQWMGIYSPHHGVAITLVGPDLEFRLKSWITAGCQMTAPSCSGWGSHPTWNDFKIHSKHIQGDWHYHTMQWMGIWSSHHAVIITLMGDPIWKVCWNHGSLPLLGAKWYHHALVEALNAFVSSYCLMTFLTTVTYAMNTSTHLLPPHPQMMLNGNPLFAFCPVPWQWHLYGTSPNSSYPHLSPTQLPSVHKSSNGSSCSHYYQQTPPRHLILIMNSDHFSTPS